MKDFTAIQNTATIKGMGYSFKAENLEEAIKKAPQLLSGEIIEVYETDDLGNKIVTEIVSPKGIKGSRTYALYQLLLDNGFTAKLHLMLNYKYSTNKKFLLVDVFGVEDSLKELDKLAFSLGYQIVEQKCQNGGFSHAMYPYDGVLEFVNDDVWEIYYLNEN